MVPVGVSLPAVQQIPGRARPWEAAVGGPEILAAARAAEAGGLAWVSCSDHVLVPAARTAAMGPVWYDAGSTLAFVAGATSRIRLLSHVLVLPYRHPLIVAKQYGTLDRLSGGRLVLGVGSGHVKPEFAILGTSYERRGQVSDDYLRAIAAAWEQEVAAYGGETVVFHDVIVAPRPAQRPRPPIWVGGNSRAALRRAARLADGWVPWQLTPEDLAAAAAAARTLRAEAGREAPFTLVAPLEVAVDAPADAVLAAAARWRRAGATALHAGLAAGSFAEWCERVAWLGREVLPGLE
ncbi:MAG TPA: TIGR03619 family F420-dependent LLM class oxidoreductase [Candidatus Binatia bacterium]|nr:TIGR03619 family F420-dependent LLM class oxidoreductase [Candidatus Binatia bacterium]